jgi:hypothetical protein
MKHLEMSGKIDLRALGISLAVTLAVILVLSVFVGRAFPDMPMPVVSLGLGWSTAIVLGTIYECVMASKSDRHGLRSRPALSRVAKRWTVS